MLAICFILGFIFGSFFGVFAMALMAASGRFDRDNIELKDSHHCKDCIYPVPADEEGCYWCEKENCEVWPFTEGCIHFTNMNNGHGGNYSA